MKRLFKPLEDMGDDSVIHIIHSEQDRLETMSDYGYEDLVPLSVADMWQFMPWQGMDSAPKKIQSTILGKLKNGKIIAIYYSLDSWVNERACYDTSEFFGWLPLPGDL